MDRRLLVLRHAKSSWDDPAVADHDRRLTPRGWRSAAAIGTYLRESVPPVELVLCSSARRARETLEGLAAAGAVGGARLQVDRALYGATTGTLLGQVRAVEPGIDTVLAIGHNPTMEDLALGLVGQTGSGASLAEMEAKFPTAALAVLGIPGEWSDLAWGTATLEAFVTPRSLP